MTDFLGGLIDDSSDIGDDTGELELNDSLLDGSGDNDIIGAPTNDDLFGGLDSLGSGFGDSIDNGIGSGSDFLGGLGNLASGLSNGIQSTTSGVVSLFDNLSGA